MVLLRIVAKHFVAGVITQEGICCRAAPIVKYMKGWTIEHIQHYCCKKTWDIKLISVGGQPI